MYQKKQLLEAHYVGYLDVFLKSVRLDVLSQWPVGEPNESAQSFFFL
jgi:hypothetical protein